jgi:hypothetical protein
MPSSSSFLLNVVAPAGIPLSDWIAEYSQPVPSQIGARWLRDWGLDLRQFAEDRDARNEVSYRPVDISRDVFVPARDASSFLIEFWSLFEPSASRFDVLDRHILRSTLEQIHKSRTGHGPLGNAQHEQSIISMFDALTPPIPRSEWIDFLLRKSNARTPRLLELAAVQSDLNDPEHHLQVISRAALMLRLATGACQSLKTEAALSRAALRFWWESIGDRRGFWPGGSVPTDCADLWADVEVASNDEKLWGTANWQKNPSYSAWKAGRANSLVVMSECERIALWGLGF